jgi:hypothetical protein
LTTAVTQQKSRGLPDRPEEFAPALAHVIRREGGQDVVLGQAWIAGANQLITCGHVVDSYVQNPSQLMVQFLSSTNRYQVRGIRLHPSFVRQPDQLVKFDAAILFVDLGYPEREANPLPIQFEKTIMPQQALSAVRYPAHLGPLSGSPNPLAQLGRYLGPLRKHDSFHLLHDLALAPGDSGTPIFDGTTVVAIHCGDTATLPGLNLPTTAIRLALWVDALREMGVNETYFPTRKNRIPMAFWAGLTAFLLALAVATVIIVGSNSRQWRIQEPVIQPVDISFNKPLHQYNAKDYVSITLLPRSNCYLYLFYVGDDDQVMMLYPPNSETSFVQAGSSRTVERFGGKAIQATPGKGKLHLVALNSEEALLRDTDYAEKNPAESPLKINGHLLEKLIQERVNKDTNAIYARMDAPTSQVDNGDK